MVLVWPAGYQWDVAGLFGAAPPSHPAYGKNNTVTGVPVELMNKNTQVQFDRSTTSHGSMTKPLAGIPPSRCWQSTANTSWLLSSVTL